MNHIVSRVLLSVLAACFVCGTWVGAQRLPSQMVAIGVDSSRADIPLEEILSGGPPANGIPAIGFTGDEQGAATATPAPRFVTQEEASAWLADHEPVVFFRLGDERRGYPLQILTWHEIVNDVVGGVPVAVTFCPLCNSALAFDRRIPLSADNQPKHISDAALAPPPSSFTERYAAQGEDAEAVTALLEVSFGVSGLLYKSNMLMFDSETSTLWSQLLGSGTVGALTGTQLLRYPAQIVSFSELRERAPDATILSRDTGLERRYGQNPYLGYDDADSPPFLFAGTADDRLLPKERVVSISSPDESVAYPFTLLADRRVLNDEVSGAAIVVFWQAGTSSALDTSTVAGGRDVGAVGVFDRVIEGQTLTFTWDGEHFLDEETGSHWTLLGRASAGELAGTQLTPVVHDNTLWFAWAAFKPDTRIYQDR